MYKTLRDNEILPALALHMKEKKKNQVMSTVVSAFI